jgi:hypothetical protein
VCIYRDILKLGSIPNKRALKQKMNVVKNENKEGEKGGNKIFLCVVTV